MRARSSGGCPVLSLLPSQLPSNVPCPAPPRPAPPRPAGTLKNISVRIPSKGKGLQRVQLVFPYFGSSMEYDPTSAFAREWPAARWPAALPRGPAATYAAGGLGWPGLSVHARRSPPASACPSPPPRPPPAASDAELQGEATSTSTSGACALESSTALIAALSLLALLLV